MKNGKTAEGTNPEFDIGRVGSEMSMRHPSADEGEAAGQLFGSGLQGRHAAEISVSRFHIRL